MSAAFNMDDSAYQVSRNGRQQNIYPTNYYRRILVVEDDPDMAQFTQFLVENYANAKCVIVRDSYEAAEELCQHKYDYIILDQNLPGQSGVDFLKNLDHNLDLDPLLSEQSRFAEKIPVLLMSAEAVQVPKHWKLNHFEIVDVILKSHLIGKLAEEFAT